MKRGLLDRRCGRSWPSPPSSSRACRRAGLCRPVRSARFTCASIEGTLWSGACGGLIFERTAARGSQLGPCTRCGLVARAGSPPTSRSTAAPRTPAATWSSASRGTLTAASRARRPAARSAALPGVPPQLHGDAHVGPGARGNLQRHHHAAAGTHRGAQPRGSRRHTSRRSAATSSASPAASGEPVGQVRDLGGPLSVEGHAAPDARRAASMCRRSWRRPDAAPELTNNIRSSARPMLPAGASSRCPAASSR